MAFRSLNRLRSRSSWLAAGLLLVVQAGLVQGQEPAESSPSERIGSVLERYIGSDEPGVAVLVTRAGETLFHGARGLSELSPARVLSPDQHFAVGSMTKPLTAVALMTLVESGRVGLDSTLADYMPDYPRADEISIAELLGHRSGVRRLHALDAYWERIEDEVELPDLIGLFRDEPLEFAPGTDWAYCNSGYYLLEQVVEIVTGLSWDEFLRGAVLEPAGMKNSLCAGVDDLPPDMASPYRREGDAWRPARAMSYSHLRSAGGLITNLEDLNRFQRALFGGKLLSRKSMGQLFAPVLLADGSRSPTGLGWFVDELDGEPMVSHGGGIFGYVAHMLYLPRQDLFVVLLSNREDRHADPGIKRLAEMTALAALGSQEEPVARRAIDLPPARLERLAGEYRIVGSPGAGGVRRLVFEGGSLLYEQRPDRRVRMLPETESRFFFEGAGTIITFAIDAEGAVRGMTLHQGGEGGRKIEFERIAE